METTFVLRNWWATALRGLIMLVFGIVLLAWPGSTLNVMRYVIGIFALIDGVVETLLAVSASGKNEKWGWLLTRGLLGLLIGIIILARPGVALVALLYVIAVWFIATGFMGLAAAFEVDAEGSMKALLGITGVLSVVVGILLILRPVRGIWAFILIIGIYSIVVGLMELVLGFMVRSFWKKAEPA